MMIGIGTIAQQVLHSNQFASGGLLLMVIGAAGAAARKVPSRMLDWLMNQASITVTVKDDDSIFGWIKLWFSTQKFAHKTRNIDLDTSLTGDVLLLPAPGSHWFWYKRRLFKVYYSREKMQGPSAYGGGKRIESFNFFVVGRNRKIIKTFVEDITKVHRENSREIPRMYRYEGSYWDEVVGYEARKLESVILPQGDKEKLMLDVNKFLNSKERYQLLGIPYHRGYLLYGPPGTGKSSLAAAVAGKLNMGLYVVNLNEFNDRLLADAMNRVSPNSVILFEDIDAMSTSVQNRVLPIKGEDDEPEDTGSKRLADKFGVTLSGLLNVLDGVHAPSNVIYLMTTNREVALDAALTRPGRIDYQLYLGEATEYQKMELARRFLSDRSELEIATIVKQSNSKTMAEFQGELLLLEALPNQIGVSDEKIVWNNDSVYNKSEMQPGIKRPTEVSANRGANTMPTAVRRAANM